MTRDGRQRRRAIEDRENKECRGEQQEKDYLGVLGKVNGKEHWKSMLAPG